MIWIVIVVLILIFLIVIFSDKRVIGQIKQKRSEKKVAKKTVEKIDSDVVPNTKKLKLNSFEEQEPEPEIEEKQWNLSDANPFAQEESTYEKSLDEENENNKSTDIGNISEKLMKKYDNFRDFSSEDESRLFDDEDFRDLLDKGVKEDDLLNQIQNLPPELKILIITNVFDRKMF